MIKHNDTIKLVFLEDDKVKGFIVGTMNPRGFCSTLLRRDWLRFALASLPAILKKPASICRIVRALKKPENSPGEPTAAELSSVAILPDSWGRGIGKELVPAFIREVKKRNGKYIYLTTDAENNDNVNAFYKKMGFKVKKVFRTPENRLMNEYSYEIEY